MPEDGSRVSRSFLIFCVWKVRTSAMFVCNNRCPMITTSRQHLAPCNAHLCRRSDGESRSEEQSRDTGSYRRLVWPSHLLSAIETSHSAPDTGTPCVCGTRPSTGGLWNALCALQQQHQRRESREVQTSARRRVAGLEHRGQRHPTPRTRYLLPVTLRRRAAVPAAPCRTERVESCAVP